jgi:DNA-binding transcriptional regulator YhcF (GntR family)
MIYGLGAQTQRVLDSLRSKIVSGHWAVGARIPSHTELAQEYGVAPLTVRHALSVLEKDGLISRQQGRGTFVQAATLTKVLLLDDDDDIRTLMEFYITDAKCQPVSASNPKDALKLLARDSNFAMILTDVRMPNAADGVDFIRSVRRRYPHIPLAAITGYPDDLNELHGTPEYPILVLTKPVFAENIQSALRMGIKR